MSIWYDFYLEGEVNGEWRAIGPFMKRKDGSVNLVSFASGQSSMEWMLNDIDYWYGMPKGISNEVMKELAGRDVVVDDLADEDYHIFYERTRWFPLSCVRADPARFEHEAYVGRESMNKFELGDIEEICDWITPEEYAALPTDERRAYTYFRWTDPGGSYDMRCRLKALARELIHIYEASVLLHEDDADEVSSARVVVRVC